MQKTNNAITGPYPETVYTGWSSEYLQGTLEHHWKNLKLPHTGVPLEKLWLLQPTLKHHWGDFNSPHTPRHIQLSRVASMSVWLDTMPGQEAAIGQVSVNSAFSWSVLLCNGYQVCSRSVWVLQHHSAYALDMSTIFGFFVYLGLQFK